MQQLAAPSEHVKPLISELSKVNYFCLVNFPLPLPIPIENVWSISPSLKRVPIFCIINAIHDIWRQILNNLRRQVN